MRNDGDIPELHRRLTEISLRSFVRWTLGNLRLGCTLELNRILFWSLFSPTYICRRGDEKANNTRNCNHFHHILNIHPNSGGFIQAKPERVRPTILFFTVTNHICEVRPKHSSTATLVKQICLVRIQYENGKKSDQLHEAFRANSCVNPPSVKTQFVQTGKEDIPSLTV